MSETETTADPRGDWPVMTPERFEHGLRCGRCKRLIEPGQPFSGQASSVNDRGETSEVLVCVYCGGVE